MSASAEGPRSVAAEFYRDVLREEPPRLLRSFTLAQSLRGHAAVQPDDPSLVGLHPLMIPLSQEKGGQRVVHGVLCVPPSIHMGGDCQRPLVEAVPSPLDGGATHHYTLLAKDVGARVNRLAAEAEFHQPYEPATRDLLQSLASEQSAGDVYREGDATAKDAVALRSHLLTKVWWFADLLQVPTPSKPPVHP
jgi:hypothetical protein